MAVDYQHSLVEPKWQKYWEERKTFKTTLDTARPKYYVLDMFPYPSGSGLHIGHPEGYTATDIVARAKRMQGFNVLHPMGWDAFGLPAERTAVRENMHPEAVTERNIKTFRRQCKSLGFSYDWDRELSTTDTDYYKWTQWIFLKLYEMGLAYMAEVPVNWCPAQGTVLANEEVRDGVFIETGDPVERRMMRQWMLKITAYADRLVEDLEGLDWPASVLEMQRQWIGRSKGAIVKFEIKDSAESFEIFTTRPDTLFGATYCVMAPEHPLVPGLTTTDCKTAVDAYRDELRNLSDRERELRVAQDKTGVFTGAYAVNPVNGKAIPIWISDYVKMDYGSGAIMAVPAHDQRDFDFAKIFNLPIIPVIEGGNNDAAYDGDGKLINSDFLNGLDVESAKTRIIAWIEEKGLGRPHVTYKLRDWLFSRQRYWGEPFPLMHKKDGTIVPVPMDALPVTLPQLTDFRPTNDGRPPLARAEGWLKVELNGEELERETNTMPQWAGSCWYYLRFMDPKNDNAAFSPEAEKYWGPVDLYIGGVEHAVLHLLYARFWHKVLYDCGLVHTTEPFKKLFNQCMILGVSHRDEAGKYYAEADTETRDGDVYAKGTDKRLTVKVEKMSKSKLNGANPDDVVKDHGADALRMYEMFMGPLEATKPWQSSNISGITNFLSRVWSLTLDLETGKPSSAIADVPESSASEALLREINGCVAKVTSDIENLRFNTAIAKMMEFVTLAKKQEVLPRSIIQKFVLLLSPFAPHIAEELWERLGNAETLAYEKWPVADEAWLKSDTVTIVIQVNGKKRETITIAKGASEQTVIDQARDLEKVKAFVDGKDIKNKIFVQDRLLNLIVA